LDGARGRFFLAGWCLWLSSSRELVDGNRLPHLIEKERIGMYESLAVFPRCLDQERRSNNCHTVLSQHWDRSNLVHATFVVGRGGRHLVGIMLVHAAHALGSNSSWASVGIRYEGIAGSVDTVDNVCVRRSHCFLDGIFIVRRFFD